jgi:hypothetical protein
MRVTYAKQIVCFANSWKTGGSCVAGRTFTPRAWGPWVRPVSQRATHEVWDTEKRYADGSMPSVLDIVDLPLLAPQPLGHQQENHVIDGSRWTKRGAVTWGQIQGAVEDPGGPLWANGHSTWKGTNDSVTEADAASFQRSLYLIRPVNLRVVSVLDVFKNRYQTRAQFTLCGEPYCLTLTDSVAAARFAPQDPNDETLVPDALMCVSLTEAFKGAAYKLAAAIITP